MRKAQEVLREQVQFESGLNNEMFQHGNVGGIYWSWEGHVMGRTYLWAVYYAVHEMVMQNVSRDFCWSERAGVV